MTLRHQTKQRHVQNEGMARRERSTEWRTTSSVSEALTTARTPTQPRATTLAMAEFAAT